MTKTRAMDAKDWVKVVVRPTDREHQTEHAPPLLGVELNLGGQTTVCFEHDYLGQNHPFRQVFGLDFDRHPRLLPRHIDVVLIVCLSFPALDVLREIGFEVRADGLPRVGSIGHLKAFGKHSGALNDPVKEARLQQVLRVMFHHEWGNRETIIDFERRGTERWILPRVAHPGQLQVPSELLELIKKRLSRSWSPATDAPPAGDPLSDFIAELTSLLKLLRGVVAGMPEDEVKRDARRWLNRADRWLLRILEALKMRHGRLAMMKLVMAIAFPRQRPTKEQIQELFEAMGRDVQDVLDVMAEEARRSAARDMCRDALRQKFGSLPERVQSSLDAATYDQLRGWLLLMIQARTLSDIFPSRSPSAKGNKLSLRSKPSAKGGKDPSRKKSARPGKQP